MPLTDGQLQAPQPNLVFEVQPGVPEDWDDQVGDVPPTLRRKWITLAQARIAGGAQAFCLSTRRELSVAMIGGILESPTGHVRFDPYQVLAGGSTDDAGLPDEAHPWRGRPVQDVFPCCLLMFPNYETAPAGPGARDLDAVRAFVDSLVQWCRANGLRSIAGLFLRPDYPELLSALESAGFTLVPMAERADMAVTWSDFDGYLQSLPRKRRFVVRRELRDIAQHGIVIDERPLGEDEAEILGLRAQLVVKYGGTPDDVRELATLRHMRDNFGPGNVMVVEARHGSHLVGFSLVVRDGDHWTVPMSGTDYTHPAATFTYFATMFYRPAELAPRHGIRSIAYGLGTIEAKKHRGCTISTLVAAALLTD